VARTHYQLLGIEPNATRAEIDAALTRRENQYRDLVRTGQRPKQQIIERVRNAHATLVDPDARAAYDRALARAARRTARTASGMRAPSLQMESWLREEREGNFFARAWRAEERPWKPLWLLVAPAVLVALGAAAVLGGFVGPVRGALPPAAPAAIAAVLGIAAVVGLVGAVLLWHCAFTSDSRLLGLAARAAALFAVAILAFAAYSAATRTLWPAGPAPQSTPGQSRLAATHPTVPGEASAAFPPAGR
jgi:hypothetical protein